MEAKELHLTPADLKVVANTLGINYPATVHMYQMSAVNETLIINDLRQGLIFEWLIFINLHLLDHPSNFEQSVMKLFSDDLGDFMRIDVSGEEIDKMLDDRSYAGLIRAINLDENNYQVDRILFRLNLTQYIKLLKIGAKS